MTKQEDIADLDFSDWEEASGKEAEALKASSAAVIVKVPIDFENKKFITLYINDMTINDQLGLMEQFLSFDDKGKMTLNMRKFYKAAWTKTVQKSSPPIKWKDVKYYKKAFYPYLKKILPNPFEMAEKDIGGVDEEEENL